MARIVVLLLIIVSAAMFMIVLNIPTGTFFTHGGMPMPASAVAPAKAAPRNASKDRKAAAIASDRESTSSPQSPSDPSTVATDSSRGNAGGSPQPSPVQPIRWTVASDTAAVYSTNSSTGAVLQVLNKGDVVSNNFEVLAAGGRWVLVDVENRNVSGFVRRDNVASHPLQRTTPQ